MFHRYDRKLDLLSVNQPPLRRDIGVMECGSHAACSFWYWCGSTDLRNLRTSI